ncbi:hypothetical protein SAMN05660477_02905 [Soonwooa buanensis]|uniref:Uncharacterized protein n=1 Tax=Soonwooa buanensis TaxID=619805 RepID=A0A1T5GIS1_9FLAO|nr:hypothetical protein [Soonwooa buanensis]SKC08344.1 hypothetical protein SAMN05660477_02905 [Soonwooa buanensis]
MKNNLLIFSLVLASILGKAQVSIGKDSVTNSSVLLEFGSANKGIILPTTIDAPTNATDGTFIVNKARKSVQVKQNGIWTDLTGTNSVLNNPFINAGNLDVGESVIIGKSSSAHEGILILESTTRAMVLPKVSNPSTIVGKPVIGTMLYDTVSDSLAVFDGVNWHYWK